jgi:hypothetical protein
MVSMVHVDLSALKEQLLPLASRVFDGMAALLQGAFARHCELVIGGLRSDCEWLQQRPTDLVRKTTQDWVRVNPGSSLRVLLQLLSHAW